MLKDLNYKIDSIAIDKKDKKNDCFIDKHIKHMKWVPAAKYDLITDWTKNFGKRGKLLKGPKVTFTENVIFQGKKSKVPHNYPIEQKETGFEKAYKLSKECVSKNKKICEFIEEAKWQGMQAPGHKHNVNYDRIDKKLRVAR